MRSPNRFENPANGVVWEWPINHEEEEPGGRLRDFDFEANTSNVGLVVQQGDLQPDVLRFTGTILTQAQLDMFALWHAIGESQSVYFYDFAGDGFEVLIAKFQPRRVRAALNPRDLANAPRHFWKYTIEMVVLDRL